MSFIDDFNHLKIKLKDIKSATNDFSDNPIGIGGFGKVFKGELSLPDGEKKMVAFKRLDRRYGQGHVEFWKEIMMLSQYKHENLISLLGYCDDDGEKILVYEYASGGSLDHHLDKTSLTWTQLLKICLEAARGLNHLHDPAGTQQRVLHRDIKSSNILLDENFTAKISDFGLSKFGPANQQYTYLVSHACGTPGYCDPLYTETGSLSKESDVYSFGVVLFEVMCGRLCFESCSNGQQNILVQKWKKCYEENGINDIISNHLKEQMDIDICFRDSLKMVASIAYRCLNRDRKERPTMAEVVKELVMALDIQDEIKADMHRNLDTDWEGKLPSDYADIIKLSKDNMQAKTHQELHYLLRSGFLINTKERSQKFRLRGALSLIFDFLVQDFRPNALQMKQWRNLKWFSVSKRMKKRHMLPAIVVFKRPFTRNMTTMRGSWQQVAWISPFQKITTFKWKSLPESRFGLVAECCKIKEFTIVCELEAELLSMETAYACYLVYKLPTKHSLVSGLIQIDDKTRRGKSNHKLLLVNLLTSTHIPFNRRGVDEPHDIPIRTRKIKGHPKLRKDGWLEIQIWDFYTDATHKPITMHCHVKSYDECNLTGILVQGIEFRPAKNLFASSP